MKLGIVSDIHEAVELLEIALARLEREGVDRVIVLGDVFETGPRLDATTRLLERAGAVGVYGNHDYGLSNEPSDYVRQKYSAGALAYMGTLLPRMEVDGTLLAHREPWLDCSDVCQVWHVEDEPFAPELIDRSFDAVPHPSILIGHFHDWIAFRRSGRLDWSGGSPLDLAEGGPTMVVVHAVCDGHAATFDTATRVLTPIDLYDGHARPETRPLPPLVPG